MQYGCHTRMSAAGGGPVGSSAAASPVPTPHLSPALPRRWAVDLPSHIIIPIISCCIVYWMVGYQATAAKFWIFTLTNVLLDNTGAALGILVSCIFNDISVRGGHAGARGGERGGAVSLQRHLGTRAVGRGGGRSGGLSQV